MNSDRRHERPHERLNEGQRDRLHDLRDPLHDPRRDGLHDPAERHGDRSDDRYGDRYGDRHDARSVERHRDPHAASASASPFDLLLRQRAQTGAMPTPGQVILGTLQALPGEAGVGAAQVPGLGRVAVAHSLVPLKSSQVGLGVALSLLDGGNAIVLGLLWSGEDEASGSDADADAAHAKPPRDAIDHAGPGPLAVTVDGHREVIEAAEELELRCGDACIVLTADGRIQLRGTYITSHASATQRIVGGAVHVN